MVNARAFKHLPLCSAPLKTYYVVISEAVEMRESHYVSKNVFWENAVEYLINGKF